MCFCLTVPVVNARAGEPRRARHSYTCIWTPGKQQCGPPYILTHTQKQQQQHHHYCHDWNDGQGKCNGVQGERDGSAQQRGRQCNGDA